MEKIESNKADDDFYECLLYGIICLSATIKASGFPDWEGTEYLSTKLGTYQKALMRLTYDYIRWQRFEEGIVEKSYKS